MASKKSLLYITSTDRLRALLAEHGNKPVAKAKVIGVHFQFAHEGNEDADADRVVAIAIGNDAPTSTAVVLQVASLSSTEVVAGLRKLLEDPATIKVTFNIRRVARWLHRYGMTRVALTNCLDLQLVYRNLVDKKMANISLSDFVSQLGGKTTIALEQQVAEFHANLKPQAWTKSPLAPPMLRTLVTSMQIYGRCYHAVCGLSGATTKIPTIYTATSNRWVTVVTKLDAQSSSSSTACSASTLAAVTIPKAQNQQKTLPTVPAPRPPKEATVSPSSEQLTQPSSPRDIKYITSDLELQRALSNNNNNNNLVHGTAPVVGVHFQFTCEQSPSPGQYDDDQLVAISIVGANPLDTAIVLQLDSLNQDRVRLALKTLLTDPATVKVMHDVHRAAFCLHRNGLTDRNRASRDNAPDRRALQVREHHIGVGTDDEIVQDEGEASGFRGVVTQATARAATADVGQRRAAVRAMLRGAKQNDCLHCGVCRYDEHSVAVRHRQPGPPRHLVRPRSRQPASQPRVFPH
ncbi:hypothetical protein ON010_g11462 [Phytophthora cinnamomi]|nr:hypothetical protein ON010_g11462 [Phytophthora cinnamomi]